MKIAFYADEIAREGGRGVKTYSLEIIKNLLEIDDKNQYCLYSSGDISEKIKSPKAKLIFAEPGKHFWAFSVFTKLIKKDRPDVVFMPIQTFPFFAFRGNKPKVVVTVHDVAFRLFPEQFTFLRRKLLEFHTKRSIRLADSIIVPSEATKKDILRFYDVNPEKIRVIYHGYSKKLVKNPEKRDEEVKSLTANSPYILFVGSIQPRKNIVRLAEAFAIVKGSQKYADLKLVICGGKGWMYEKIYEEIAKNPFAADIILTGSVSDELLSSLYQNAQFFVLPSLYEGFGLPVLEAMSFGLPVVCANNSSLSEIVGDAGLLVDEYDVQNIADKLEMLLSSQSLKAELAEKSLERIESFSWKKSAEETLQVIKEVGPPHFRGPSSKR
ncbi:MAG: glycosyltransferase family 1 protein [Candidatus Paceibacterota bacterium]